jgi:uncharacterized MAPEG superfamily protein
MEGIVAAVSRSLTARAAPAEPAENLIKAHKLHLASDRTSCRKATANQFRLLIHTAAYWLMLSLRGPAPKTSLWRDAQFDTIRLCLINTYVARWHAVLGDRALAAPPAP